MAGPLTIRIGHRFMNMDCMAGPPSSDLLIGQVVLEELDPIADCANRALTPRPESPDYPPFEPEMTGSGRRRPARSCIRIGARSAGAADP